MLGKMLKYDIKYGKNAFLLMAGAILLASTLLHLFNSDLVRSFGLAMILPLALIGMFVASVVLVYQNFNRNIFGAEGYLTLTLPAKRNTLILSKLMITLMWFNIMLMVLGAAMFLMFTSELKNVILIHDRFFWFSGILALFYMNLMAVNSTLFLYMMSAMSHFTLAGRRPGAWLGIAAFIGAIVLEVLTGRWVIVPLLKDYGNLWVAKVDANSPLTFHWGDIFIQHETVHSAMSIDFSLILLCLLFCAAAWLVTLYCLKKRVDLP